MVIDPVKMNARVITRVLQSEISKMNNNTIWIPMNMLNGQNDQKAENENKIVAPPPSPSKQQAETGRPQDENKFKDPWTPTVTTYEVAPYSAYTNCSPNDTDQWSVSGQSYNISSKTHC